MCACVRGTLARSWSWNNTGKLTQWLPGFLERLGLQGKGDVELPVWQTGSAAKGVDDLETGEELLVIGGRNKQDVEGKICLYSCLPSLLSAHSPFRTLPSLPCSYCSLHCHDPLLPPPPTTTPLYLAPAGSQPSHCRLSLPS